MRIVLGILRFHAPCPFPKTAQAQPARLPAAMFLSEPVQIHLVKKSKN